jgi:hypothetical protein
LNRLGDGLVLVEKFGELKIYPGEGQAYFMNLRSDTSHKIAADDAWLAGSGHCDLK